jgi:hypothetical protein
VKRLVLVLSAAGCIAAALAAPAGATNECRGLMVCVPIAGPWVVVPTRDDTPRAHVEYQLTCPRGYIVGGLDAELSRRAIDVSFAGTLGSPVNPGITTSRAAVFTGRYVGQRRTTATFRPHVGCMPATGGGGRRLNSLAAFPPGRPAVRRVSFVRVTAGTQQAVRSCKAGERLISATHAIGFFTDDPPGARLVSSVSAGQTVRNGLVLIAVRGGPALGETQAVVQVGLVCAGGR